MRIIAGKLGGRTFRAPRGRRTHPMSDRVRGALFNTLGDISGLSVLDAFAGSGALSFEAVSRGAALAVAIDLDRLAQQTIQANIKSLGITDSVKLVRAAAGAWLSTSDQQFDIVLCDPPYNDVSATLLERLAARAKPSGIIVFSLPPADGFSLSEPYTLLETKDYGDAVLVFYRKVT